ncbi:MAG: 2-amino-4-hydroxy-6-hydroxymethyldihydropteridine diphosphokinase [Terracidiphilus sp.]
MRLAVTVRRANLGLMRAAYIGMGANLPSRAGPPEATLTGAVARLSSLGCVTHRSSLYSTEPVGFAAQPRFVNAVIALETDLEPRQLLEGLLGIEQEFGRDRSAGIPNGPRTLDLDILLLGSVQLHEPGLEIPHPRLTARTFVLLPLSEIAPSIVPAGQRESVSQLLHHLVAKSEREPSHEEDAAIRIHWPDWIAGPGGAGAAPARAGPRDRDRRR